MSHSVLKKWRRKNILESSAHIKNRAKIKNKKSREENASGAIFNGKLRETFLRLRNRFVWNIVIDNAENCFIEKF